MFSGSAYIIYKKSHTLYGPNELRRTCTKLCHLKTVYSNRIHINRVYYMYPHFMYRYMYRYTEIIWYIRYTIRYSWSLIPYIEILTCAERINEAFQKINLMCSKHIKLSNFLAVRTRSNPFEQVQIFSNFLEP